VDSLVRMDLIPDGREEVADGPVKTIARFFCA
jgi:hypothetical protein